PAWIIPAKTSGGCRDQRNPVGPHCGSDRTLRDWQQPHACRGGSSEAEGAEGSASRARLHQGEYFLSGGADRLRNSAGALFILLITHRLTRSVGCLLHHSGFYRTVTSSPNKRRSGDEGNASRRDTRCGSTA